MKTPDIHNKETDCPCAGLPFADCNVESSEDGVKQCSYFNPAINQRVAVKDYSHQPYRKDDEKDFRIRTIHDEKLIDSIPGQDESAFNEDMFVIGDAEDLPESDRILNCEARGINKRTCLDK